MFSQLIQIWQKQPNGLEIKVKDPTGNRLLGTLRLLRAFAHIERVDFYLRHLQGNPLIEKYIGHVITMYRDLSVMGRNSGQ